MKLNYGRGSVRLDADSLPSEPEVLTGNEPSAVEDEHEAVTRALHNPVAMSPLKRFISARDRVVIVVPDITRTAKTDVVMSALLQTLPVKENNITIMMGLGMHRASTTEEKEQIVGAEAAKRIRVIDHSARMAGQNVEVGITSYGNKITFNKLALEADKLIVIGTIGYHLFAGLGGGRKGVMPGIAGRRCILVNHMLPLTSQQVGWNPACGPGNLDGNPAHHDMTEGALMLDGTTPIFLINTTLNSGHELTNVFAGDIVKAFERGCAFFDSHYCIRAGRTFDLVVVSCGGYPKDINFIQSHKAMEYAFPIVREGGCLVLLAECSEGLGNDRFLDWFKYDSELELELGLKKDFLLVDNMNAQTAYRLYHKTHRAYVFLVSTLPASAAQRMGMRPVDSLKSALTGAREILGSDFSTAVIAGGGYFRASEEK